MREVAEKATPGPWQNGIDDLEGVVAPDNPGLGNVICIPPLKRMYDSLERWPDNADYIATFDPPTVLLLIEENERLKAENLQIEASIQRDALLTLKGERDRAEFLLALVTAAAEDRADAR
jgi:hypothetical protein